MKRKLQFALTFIILQGIIFAQTGLPNVSSVFSEIKANPRLYEKLKTDYKIINPKSCKIEMKMTKNVSYRVFFLKIIKTLKIS